MNYLESDNGRKMDGFDNERNDCTIRAAVVRFTTSYRRAHECFERLGRKQRQRVSGALVKKFLAYMGVEVITPSYRLTLNQFLKTHPTGRFYVVVNKHAIGINNGICVDLKEPKLRKRVHFYA